MSRTRWNAIPPLVAFLIATGCGGAVAPAPSDPTGAGSPAASTSEATSAEAPTDVGGEAIGDRICSLVPVDVVAGAMGEEVTRTYTTGDSACDWDFESLSSIQFRHEGAGTELQTMREAFPGGQDVTGVGDEAYHEGSLLSFRKGDATYTVQLVLMGGEMTDAEKLEVLRSIALAALAAGL